MSQSGRRLICRIVGHRWSRWVIGQQIGPPTHKDCLRCGERKWL
jgi:hypothetical protein